MKGVLYAQSTASRPAAASLERLGSRYGLCSLLTQIDKRVSDALPAHPSPPRRYPEGLPKPIPKRYPEALGKAYPGALPEAQDRGPPEASAQALPEAPGEAIGMGLPEGQGRSLAEARG